MLFKLEGGSDDEGTPNPNPIDEDDAQDAQDVQEDTRPKRSASAGLPSAPKPPVMDHPMAFSYNTGRSWEINKQVEEKMADALRKSKDKQRNNPKSSSVKMK